MKLARGYPFLLLQRDRLPRRLYYPLNAPWLEWRLVYERWCRAHKKRTGWDPRFDKTDRAHFKTWCDNNKIPYFEAMDILPTLPIKPPVPASPTTLGPNTVGNKTIRDRVLRNARMKRYLDSHPEQRQKQNERMRRRYARLKLNKENKI